MARDCGRIAPGHRPAAILPTVQLGLARGCDESVDVLIIGGGVAGPALAAALAPHEMRVALLERHPGPLDTARGDHLQPRAVEILDMWGALGDLLGLGAEQRLGTVWYDAQGEPLLRAMVDGLGVPHPYFLYLNHELISQALLRAAARNPNFELNKPIAGWSLVEQSPTSSAIEVMIDERQTVTIDAAVLVGADGQNSSVRRLTRPVAGCPSGGSLQTLGGSTSTG